MRSMPGLLNLVLPGAGLIFLRREWLGFSLSLLFGVCGNIALAGWLIAPHAIPPGLRWLAVLLTAAIWLLAQVLFGRQWKAVHRSPVRDAARNDFAAAPDVTESTPRVS
jgi:hypothetical protein